MRKGIYVLEYTVHEQMDNGMYGNIRYQHVYDNEDDFLKKVNDIRYSNNLNDGHPKPYRKLRGYRTSSIESEFNFDPHFKNEWTELK